MAKPKLTQNQKRRILANRRKTILLHNQSSQGLELLNEEILGETQEGRVISRFASHADVENDRGEIWRCNLRRTLASLVVGDRVIWRQGKEELQGISGVIEGVFPRKNEISRPDYYDGVKPIAANLDRIVIVSALLPALSLNIIDRYLVICENAHIPAVIVVNKADLLSHNERKTVEAQLNIYRTIGYSALLISAQSGENMEEFKDLFRHGTSILVGQSGVGKSSLLNQLCPELNLATTAVSEISGLGQHTTTASRLYHLPLGGELIDSPGVREFGLWHLTPTQILAGYVEFQPWVGGCKFRDCKHLNDPHCAIREAMEAGKINRQRFENYHRLIASLTSNRSQRHFNGGSDE